MNRIPFLIMALLAIPSCLEVDMKENDKLLSPSKDAVIVPSDLVGGRHLVSDTLYVTANRTWTSILEGEPDWVTVESDGFTNLACVSEVQPLVLNFLDNETDDPRTAKLCLTSPEEFKEVIITQAPIKYRMDVTPPMTDLQTLRCDKDTIEFYVETNTSWTVSMKPGATIEVKIDSVSGKYSSYVDVMIMDNEDRSSKKTGTLVFEAKGCEPVEFQLIQMEGLPYFRVVSDTLYNAVSGINDATFGISSNVDFTCELVACEGFNASTVKTLPGKSKDTSTKIQFGYCCDFSMEEGYMRFKFDSPEIAEPSYVTIKQKPVLRMRFGSLDRIYDPKSSLDYSADLWPFKTPTFKQIPSSKKSAVGKGTPYDLVLTNGYTFVGYSVAGFWKNSGTGFMFGGKIGDWLQLPAVEGHTLVKIDYCYRSATPITFDISDSDGNYLLRNVTVGSAAQIGSVTTIDVTNAVPGKAYRLVSINNLTFNVADIILYYE